MLDLNYLPDAQTAATGRADETAKGSIVVVHDLTTEEEGGDNGAVGSSEQVGSEVSVVAHQVTLPVEPQVHQEGKGVAQSKDPIPGDDISGTSVSSVVNATLATETLSPEFEASSRDFAEGQSSSNSHNINTGSPLLPLFDGGRSRNPLISSNSSKALCYDVGLLNAKPATEQVSAAEMNALGRGPDAMAAATTRQFFPMKPPEVSLPVALAGTLAADRAAAAAAAFYPRSPWVGLSFCQPDALASARRSPLEVVHVQPMKKSRRGPRSRSSQYRGVTFYRRTGRWESHIW